MHKCVGKVFCTRNVITCDETAYHLQKAVKENHDSKRRRRIPGGSLLKKQSTEEEAKEMMGEIASEAAVVAMERSQNIRQETEKLAKKPTKEPERPKRAQGEVIASPEKEIVTIKDLKKRGVHRLDLKDRLPWLQSPTHTAEDKEGEQENPNLDREVMSPDSGVVELPNEGRPPELPPKDYPTTELLPKDYPLTELPPKDYPTTHGPGGGVLGDNDYYSLLLSPLVD